MRNVYRAMALALVVLFVGCATIIHGTTQDIQVSSQPSGAVVRVNGTTTTTPGVLKLERKRPYALVFEKEGYQPVEVHLKQTTDGWVFGNVIFGGIIGLVIDFSNGAAYKLTPSEVNAVLGQQKGAALRDAHGDMVVFVDFERLSPTMRDRLKDRKIS